jgi:hypothetical protein
MVEVGTDVAALAMGDIEAIGELLNAPNMDAWTERRDRATSSEILWRTDTGSDGSFLLHLFVDEPPRSDLAPYLKDPVAFSRFPIPSGRVLVAGEECFVKPKLDQLTMGKVVEITPGNFSLTAYRAEYPDDLAERRLRENASPEEVRAWSIGNAMPAICVIGTLLCLLASAVLYAVFTSVAIAGIPMAFAIAAWFGQTWFRRQASYRAAQDLYQRFEREYPSVVIVLKSLVQ